MYFLYPALGRLLAGTVHVPWTRRDEPAQPTEEQVAQFVSELNESIPGLAVRLEHVVRVFAGLLPVTQEGSANLSARPVLRDHARDGGPDGVVSVSGVKFTTARLVAEKALTMLDRRAGRLRALRDAPRPPLAIESNVDGPLPGIIGFEQTAILKRIVRDEAVMTVDDLLFRRTNWAITERDVDGLRRRVSDAIGWKSRKTFLNGEQHRYASGGFHLHRA
jgi:glycerol-3-phosphate dehydrogenase